MAFKEKLQFVNKKPSVFFKLFFTIAILWNFTIVNQNEDVIFASDILESGKKLYSENNEELIIRDFFNDLREGIFVDVGCAHYMYASTTYYLEKHLGWSGIGVDALAEFAAAYRENRPNTRFFNFIVTDHSGTREPFYTIPEPEYVWYSSTKKDFVEDVIEDKKIKNRYQTIYVPAITLTELLDTNGIIKIDFLSMDIEGGEPVALAGFDIERFKPALVCIEAHQNEDKIMKYFKDHSYELIKEYLRYDSINWYFKPKN